MFNLFRRNCLYNDSIDPHCAYCTHCRPDNEYQGVCEFRGIVAMAGSCRRFEYDALRRKPPKPARIRGRFTDDDFFFEEKETPSVPAVEKTSPPKPLISDDLRAFSDLWEDDDHTKKTAADAALDDTSNSIEPTSPAPQESDASSSAESQEEHSKK